MLSGLTSEAAANSISWARSRSSRGEVETGPAVRSSIAMRRQRSVVTPIFSATSASVGVRPNSAEKSRETVSACFWRRRMSREAQSQLPQAVENCAFDAVLGVSLEVHVLRCVKFVNRIEKTQYPGVDQVVEFDMHGQILVYADGDRLHQRKVIDDYLIARFEGIFFLPLHRHTLGRHVFVLFFVSFDCRL